MCARATGAQGARRRVLHADVSEHIIVGTYERCLCGNRRGVGIFRVRAWREGGHTIRVVVYAVLEDSERQRG